MDGLGLEFNGDSCSSQAVGQEKITERDHLDHGGESDREEYEGPLAHLDLFERDWPEKWLNGVVRRAQGWLEEREETETPEEMEGCSSQGIKEVEVVLRDATAVLAMMAGTSGKSGVAVARMC